MPVLMRLCVVLVLLAVCGRGEGAGVMRYVHHSPESGLDRRYDYHREILRTALERIARPLPGTETPLSDERLWFDPAN